MCFLSFFTIINYSLIKQVLVYSDMACAIYFICIFFLFYFGFLFYHGINLFYITPLEWKFYDSYVSFNKNDVIVALCDFGWWPVTLHGFHVASEIKTYSIENINFNSLGAKHRFPKCRLSCSAYISYTSFANLIG